MDDGFINLPDHELRRLSDEELMAYVGRAHGAGAAGALHRAFDLLHYRHQRRVRALLSALPDGQRDETAQEVFVAVFEAAAAGRDVGRFGPWLARVAKNHQASFWRGRGGQHLSAQRAGVSLDDDSAVATPGREGGQDAVEAEVVVEQLLATRQPAHRAIVCRYVLQGYPARDVASATGSSEDNVYQVAKRFRDDLRRLLRGEDVHPSDDDPGGDRGDRTEIR